MENNGKENMELDQIVGLRNHFTYIFEEMWGIIMVAVLMLFSSDDSFKLAYEFLKSGNLIGALMALGITFLVLGLACLWVFLRWYKTTITVKDGTVTIARRTLNQSVNSIAVQNISNINMEQNFFEIIMGTYKLKLDTNSLSTAESTDVKIVLKKRDAYAVKNLIMRMMKEIQSDEQGDISNEGVNDINSEMQLDLMEDVKEDEYDVIYTDSEIIRNCIIDTPISGVVWVLIFIALAVFAIVDGIKTASGFFSIITTIFIPILFAGSMLSAIIKDWLSDYNFRARRFQDKIYVSCGLLKKKKYAVPVNKINALKYSSTFIGRILGYYSVKTINVGGEDEDVDGMKLLLVGKASDIRSKMALLLPECQIPDMTVCKRPPKRTLVKAYITALIYILIFAVSVMFGIVIFAPLNKDDALWILLASIGLWLLVVLWRTLFYFASGFNTDGKEVFISRGTFGKELVQIPYEKIQYISIRQGPVERRLKLARGVITILASVASRIQNIAAFDVEDYDILMEKFEKTF